MTGWNLTGGIIATVAAFVFMSAGVRADILIRSDGTPIEGKVISQSATAVVFQPERETAPKTFDRAAIKRVVTTDAHGAIISDGATTQPALHWDVPAEPPAPAIAPHAAGSTYYVIPLHGEVGVTVLASALDKSLADAVLRKPTAVILDIDSPGGLVEEAKKIMEVIHRYNKSIRIIALANQDLSAAAILSLSCREIYIKATGTIGAAVAFNPSNPNLSPKVQEKMLSAWRAVARNSAEEGGHEPLLAEAMIDNSIELHLETVGGKPVVKEGTGDHTLCHKGKILTLTSREAVECGLAAGPADDFGEVGQALKVANWTECQGLGVALAEYLPKRAEAFKTKLDEVATEFGRDIKEAVNADPTRSTVTVINPGPRFAPRRPMPMTPPMPHGPGMPRRIPGPAMPPPVAAPGFPQQAVTVVSSGSPATWKRDALACVLALDASEADLRKAKALCEAFGFLGDAEGLNELISKVGTIRAQVYDDRNKYATSGTQIASNGTGATTQPGGDQNYDVTIDGRTANGGSYHREIHVEHHTTVTSNTTPTSNVPSNTQKTPLVGGPGGGEFSKVSPTGGPIYGLRVRFGNWNNRQVLGSVEPLFDRPAAGAVAPAAPGTTELVARAGFVVGGLIVNADKVNAFAFRVIFVGFSNSRVDPATTYTSDWVGKPLGDVTRQMAGKGETVVGICGRQGMNCDALGLVVQSSASAAAAPTTKPVTLVAATTQPATVVAVTPIPAGAGAPAGPNMLAQMVMPRDAQTVNGEVYLPTRGIKTAGNISVPFRADIIAKTDSTNIRLGYGRQGLVIFNWEMKPDTLRYHDPVKGIAGLVSLDGKGSIPANEFVHITWIMTETGSRLLVNGEERASVQGDYHNLSEVLSVNPAMGSHITVRSVVVTPAK